MKNELDDPDNIRVKPGTGGAKGDTKRIDSVSKSLTRRMARSGLKGSGNRSGYRRNSGASRGGSRIGNGRGYPQRVVVKSHYVKHGTGGTTSGKLRAHANYLQRDGAGADGERADFYSENEDAAEVTELLERAADDRHHFRLIVSPENADQLEDMQAYTRDVMQRVEKDLETKLDWVAVDHFNTDNPHTHVIVRGKDDRGNDLVIAPEYVKEGFRNRAQEVATEQLRERSIDDIQRSMMKEVDAERFTSLDNRIGKHLSKNNEINTYQSSDLTPTSFHRKVVVGRLMQLESMGLAEKTGPNQYEVHGNLKGELKSMSRKNDVVKNLYPRHGNEATSVQLYDPSRNSDPIVGRIVDKGLDDELYGRTYLLVRDGQEKLHYVPDQKKRGSDELPTGSLVRVGPVESKQTKTNENIQQIADKNGGVYTAQAHAKHVEKNQSYIPEGDRDGYIDAHIQRLETLERSGLAAKVGDNQWQVDPDMPQRAQEIADKMNADQKDRKFTRVEVLSDRPVSQQKGAHADTWLDKELTRRTRTGAQTMTFDRHTESALSERREWLARNGYAQRKNDQTVYPKDMRERLRTQELSQTMQREYGKQYQAPPRQGEVEGKYRGTHNLKSGRYAAIERGGRITAVRVRNAPQVQAGQEVAAKIGRAARATLQAVRDRGLG